MNHRQRFAATMHYQARDRVPLYDFNYWLETIDKWYDQGLPRRYDSTNAHTFFGLDASLGGGIDCVQASGITCSLTPGFEQRVIEDLEDSQVVVQADGAMVRRSKVRETIPIHVGHTLVDRQSWREHYLPRLDPDNPDRLPPDWDERARNWTDPNRDNIVTVHAGSLFGWLRNWMGLENIALVPYDDPAWFEEMVTTIADLAIATLTKAFDTGGQFDGCAMWEDMCYNAGPLLSPDHFKQFLVPQYRRITELCHKHGVDVVWVDCDGCIDHLLPLWLEAGVNCMFPVEIGNWADPVEMRKRFGKDLLMMGGFDKHILARSKEAIDTEIERLMPLVDEGAFIPFCDHRVSPDVSLDNYIHYCRRAREVWGKGIDLPPMEASD